MSTEALSWDLLTALTRAEQAADALVKAGVTVTPGISLSLSDTQLVMPPQLRQTMSDLAALSSWFRPYGHRTILDFRVGGTPRLRLVSPHLSLNPLLVLMTGIAERTLAAGSKLALLQVVVNHLATGSELIPPHRHGCPMVCLVLGASRDVVVKDRAIWMRHGDAILLSQHHLWHPCCQGHRRSAYHDVHDVWHMSRVFCASTTSGTARGGVARFMLATTPRRLQAAYASPWRLSKRFELSPGRLYIH